MANIPANPLATKATASITGSYAVFNGLKDANGVELATSGSPATLRFLEGQTYPIFVTSASLAASSANVLFYT